MFFFLLSVKFYVVSHKKTELDQFSIGIYLSESENVFKLLLNEMHFGLYNLSNDTKIVTFGSKLKTKLRVTINNLELKIERCQSNIAGVRNKALYSTF